MNNELRLLDEVDESLRDGREDGFVGKERVTDTVDGESLFRHGAFGVDILVIGAPGGHLMPQFHRPDLDDAMAVERV